MNNQTYKKQKNGSVEFLRFLFTSIIIFFHINLDLWDQKKVIAVIGDAPVTFFNHGNIGVEFFFLVTGWLMAKTIYSRYIQPKTSCHAESSGKADRADKAGSTDQTMGAGSTGDADNAGTGIFTETMSFVTHKSHAIFP